MGLAGALAKIQKIGQAHAKAMGGLGGSQDVSFYLNALYDLVKVQINQIPYEAVRARLLSGISMYQTSPTTGTIVISHFVTSAVDNKTVANLAGLHEHGWVVRKHAYVHIGKNKKIPLYQTGVGGSHFASKAAEVFNTMYYGQAFCEWSEG